MALLIQPSTRCPTDHLRLQIELGCDALHAHSHLAVLRLGRFHHEELPHAQLDTAAAHSSALRQRDATCRDARHARRMRMRLTECRGRATELLLLLLLLLLTFSTRMTPAPSSTCSVTVASDSCTI